MIKASVFFGIAAATMFAFGGGCSAPASEDTGSVESEAASSTNVTISQIYSAGGMKGSTYATDFVEIFNRGQWPVSLEGVSIQLADMGVMFDASRVIKLPNKTLARGSYFLVELGTAAQRGAALPTPDHHSDLTMAPAAGRVALVRTPLANCGGVPDGGTSVRPCRPSASLSMVSYGGAAVGLALPELTPTLGLKRKDNGCADNGDDQADFEPANPPVARNNASPAAGCAAPANPPVDGGAELVRLNEISVGPQGGVLGSPFGYVEIQCTAKASLAEHYLVITDETAKATLVYDLGKKPCGANGLAYVKGATTGHLASEPQSSVHATLTAPDGGATQSATSAVAVMIVKSPSAPALGTEFDVNQDGTPELPANGAIVDAIALAAASVPVPKFVPRLDQPAGLAAGATRIGGDTKPSSNTSWYAGALKGGEDAKEYDPTKATPNLPKNAVLTPGAKNFVATTGGNNRPDGGAGDAATTTVTEPGDDTPSVPAPSSPAATTNAAPAPAGAAKLESADSVCSTSAPGAVAGPGFSVLALVGLALARVSRRRRRA